MNEYNEQIRKECYIKLKQQEKKLPRFIGTYFKAIEHTTSPRTRLAYAYDLTLFFDYLVNNEDDFNGYLAHDLPVEVFAKINIFHIENFVEYINFYSKETSEKVIERTNHERGINRKISAIKTMLKYFYKRQLIPSNPGELVEMAKLHEKNIVRLEPDEVAIMLDNIENGSKLTKQQLNFNEKTRVRDLALVSLLLGTGIRISECLGLNIADVDFENNAIKIVRKGGNEDIVYFSDEVQRTLLEYMAFRYDIDAQIGHENALFLSLQNKRITPRAVQNLVKKYGKTASPLKKITPHKLRSTYGTKLYNESGDIYLVATVLGHKDVNTTRKHYATIEEDKKRQAPKFITLRDDN